MLLRCSMPANLSRKYAYSPNAEDLAVSARSLRNKYRNDSALSSSSDSFLTHEDLLRITHGLGRKINSPPRPSVCDEALPVVPTNANSADPSRAGGGGFAAGVACANASVGHSTNSNAIERFICRATVA